MNRKGNKIMKKILSGITAMLVALLITGVLSIPVSAVTTGNTYNQYAAEAIQYGIGSYIVVFDSQGGSAIASVTAKYNTNITVPTTPQKTNCQFGGWYKDAAFSESWSFSTDGVTSNMILYAKWVVIPVNYAVSFDTQGGGTSYVVNVSANRIIYAPPAPSKEGYIFAGWYREVACKTAWNFGVDAVTSSITLYAKWVVASVSYQTHVQDIGWQDYVSNGVKSGTSGQSKRLEAIKIRLTGAAADKYEIYYRVHAQDTGWLDWAKNGEPSGTAGFGYRLEAIEIVLVPKGGAAPGAVTKTFVDFYAAKPIVDSVSYKTHVQDVGWQAYVSNGEMSGTSAQSKRLEAIQIKLENIAGSIQYRTHVQDIGWMAWAADDALSGTSAQSKRLEAIQIKLTGAAAEKYDIYYCVHAQNTGWLDWAKNGESAGTAAFGYRLEAIKIVLVPKGGAAPGATARAFIQG